MNHEDVCQDSYVDFMGEEWYVLYVGHEAEPIIITKPINKDMKPMNFAAGGWPVYDRALIELVKAHQINQAYKTPFNPIEETYTYNLESRLCLCDIKQLVSMGHSTYCPWYDSGYEKKEIIS